MLKMKNSIISLFHKLELGFLVPIKLQSLGEPKFHNKIFIGTTLVDVGFQTMKIHTYLQWFALENQQSSFYVVNEVTLTGQNSSLKF